MYINNGGNRENDVSFRKDSEIKPHLNGNDESKYFPIIFLQSVSFVYSKLITPRNNELGARKSFKLHQQPSPVVQFDDVFGHVFDYNNKWIANKLASDSNYFEKLSAGQKPQVLYIGCSDSRVTAEEIMGLEPGEAFVHRNIANQVITIDMSSISVITYAVKYLKVKHIVICGHQCCGGIKAAMQSQDLGVLNPWLRNIRDVYRLHKAELNAIEREDHRYERLVELNVQEQCVNVIKHAVVQQAMRQEGLQVHGWVFDLRNGKLIDLKINFDKILEEIREIYRLD